MSPRPSISYIWQRLKRSAAIITTGGSWSVQLPDQVQRNLRWYFLDGVFSSSQEAINVTYLTLFVLALGASKAQIGLMTSLASLSAVVLLLPGAVLSERFGKRKWVVSRQRRRDDPPGHPRPGLAAFLRATAQRRSPSPSA